MSDVPRIRFGGNGPERFEKLGGLMSYLGSGQSNQKKNEHGPAWLIDRETLTKHSLIKEGDPQPCEISKSAAKLKRGDLIFTLSGSSDGDIAKVAVVDCDLDNLYSGDFLAAFRPNYELDSYYVLSVLNELDFVRYQFVRYSQRGTGITNIKRKDIMRAKIPVKPIEEQRKIGKLFKTLDDEIQRRMELDAELKESKQFGLQNMFV